MAQKIPFNGKLISRPGVYSSIKSGVKNNPAGLDYGHVVIIDDGIGAGFGGGQGGAVNDFETVDAFQSFVKGGELWNIGLPLFKPLTDTPSIPGVSKLTLIHARETTAANMAYSALTNGTLNIKTLDEGVNANGVLTSSVLTAGYASKFLSSLPAVLSTYAATLVTAAASGVKEKRKLVLANPAVGDQFSTVFGTVSVTINRTATSTSTLGELNALKALFEANATLAAAYTFAIETISNVICLTVESKTVNSAFTLTGTPTQPSPKLKIQIFHGSYKGMDALNSVPYDGISAANSAPELVIDSPYFSTIQGILDWAATDARVKAGFVITGTISDGSGGVITSTDISNNTSLLLATGGLEQYTPNALTAARTAARQMSNAWFLATKYRSNANSSENDALVDLATSGGKYQRSVVIGGGADNVEFESISKPAAAHFNKENVIVIHGDGLNPSGPSVFKRVSSFWKAANLLGRICGLEVQTPITFKRLDIGAEFDPLPEDKFEDANDAGVMITYFDTDFGFTVVELGCNTLQNNTNLINEDGTSYSVQIVRIKQQLNKELSLYLKKKFFSNQTAGPNRNTVSTEEIVSATDTFLKSKHATTNQDNYLLSHQDIVAAVQGIAYKVDYKFSINSEVDMIIPTGTIIDNN